MLDVGKNQKPDYEGAKDQSHNYSNYQKTSRFPEGHVRERKERLFWMIQKI